MAVDVVICAPSRAEEKALRSGWQPQHAGRVVRTGVGRLRTLDAAAGLDAASAVAVAGIAGGLDPRIRAGDVVVANRVWSTAGEPARDLPAGRLIAARLRAEGLRVWLGPVVSADHVVTGAERETLRAQGAVAVDMESAWLLADGRPGAVVRVVADVAGEPLLRPKTLRRLRSAVQVLPKVAGTLGAWADAVGARSVLLAEPRSFCAGVDRAIEVVERALDQRGAPVYVRKQIVHNQHVVADLRARGARFVNEIDEVPAGETVVLSAHGVSPAVWENARSRGLDIIDATCPLVSKVHSEVRRFAGRGDTVIFIGHAGHEETEGTMGEPPERTVLVEDVEDARLLEIENPDRVSYLVQTTLSVRRGGADRRGAPRAVPEAEGAAHRTTSATQPPTARTPCARSPPTASWCWSSGPRTPPTVSGWSRSAQRLGAQAHLVDDADDVDLGWLAGVTKVGLTAGASAPPALVDEVVEALGGLGPVETTTRTSSTKTYDSPFPRRCDRHEHAASTEPEDRQLPAPAEAAARDKFPLLVELEPLFACNLQCAGCGKIQQPADELRRRMPVSRRSTRWRSAGHRWCPSPAVSR